MFFCAPEMTGPHEQSLWIWRVKPRFFKVFRCLTPVEINEIRRPNQFSIPGLHPSSQEIEANASGTEGSQVWTMPLAPDGSQLVTGICYVNSTSDVVYYSVKLLPIAHLTVYLLEWQLPEWHAHVIPIVFNRRVCKFHTQFDHAQWWLLY